MESIINFLETYWGYTLFGGVTFGTLITFIVFQIKTLLKSKTQHNIVNDLMKDVDGLITKLNEKEQEKLELIKEKRELDQVQALTFKAISYLVAASKLPNEDKIALQKDFVLLAQRTKDQTITVAEDIAVEVKDTVIESATGIVEETLERTNDLLSKYTQV